MRTKLEKCQKINRNRFRDIQNVWFSVLLEYGDDHIFEDNFNALKLQFNINWVYILDEKI